MEGRFKHYRQTEKGIAIVRLAVIVFCTITYFSFFNALISNTILVISFAILSIVYGVYINLTLPYENLSNKLATLFTYGIDLILILTWMYLTGGWQSPFWMLLLISAVGFALRFKILHTFILCEIYTLAFFVVGLFYDGFSMKEFPLAEFVVKGGFLCLTAILAGVKKMDNDISSKANRNQSAEVKQIREKLSVLQERIDIAASQMPFVVLIVNLDRNITYFSQARIERNMRTKSLYLNKSVFDFIHPNHHQEYAAALDTVSQQLKSVEIEVYTELSDLSRPSYFKSVISPCVIDGKIDSFVIVIEDVTDKKLNAISTVVKHVESSQLEDQVKLAYAQGLVLQSEDNEVLDTYAEYIRYCQIFEDEMRVTARSIIPIQRIERLKELGVSVHCVIPESVLAYCKPKSSIFLFNTILNCMEKVHSLGIRCQFSIQIVDLQGISVKCEVHSQEETMILHNFFKSREDMRLCKDIFFSVLEKEGHTFQYLINGIETRLNINAFVIEPEKAREEKQITYDFSHIHFYILEDNSINTMLLVKMLQNANVQHIQTFQNGLEAFEYFTSLDQWLPHMCTLIDVEMPEMNGPEFVAAMRARGLLSKMHLIGVTAHVAPEKIAAYPDLDCVQNWIYKPYNPQQLYKTIEVCTEKV